MILGLDIGTSITGYTILDLDGNLVEMSHVNMTKIKDGMWMFYGWKEKDGEAPQAKAFLLIDNSILNN